MKLIASDTEHIIKGGYDFMGQKMVTTDFGVIKKYTSSLFSTPNITGDIYFQFVEYDA